MFHCLARDSADLLIGGTNSDRSQPAWKQAYRALEHGYAKQQCRNKGVLRKFPKKIEDFGNTFVTLQEKRHSADYDPVTKLNKSAVSADIDLAEQAITQYRTEKTSDRRAFCAWVLLRVRA